MTTQQAIYNNEIAVYGVEQAIYGEDRMSLEGNITEDKLGITGDHFIPATVNGITFGPELAEFEFTASAGDVISTAFTYASKEGAGGVDPILAAAVYKSSDSTKIGSNSTQFVVSSVSDGFDNDTRIDTLELVTVTFAGGLIIPEDGDYHVRFGHLDTVANPSSNDVRIGTTAEDTGEEALYSTASYLPPQGLASSIQKQFSGWIVITTPDLFPLPKTPNFLEAPLFSFTQV